MSAPNSSAQPMTDSDTPTHVRQRYRFPGTVIACWIVFLGLTAISGWVMDLSGSRPSSWIRWHLETMVVSFLCALIALGTIVAGLGGRSWIVSWLLTIVLACIHTAVILAVQSSSSIDSDDWNVCAIWPALFLSTCAPLVLMRSICGWSLVRRASPVIPRWKSSLEDLMMFGVAIACAMTATQVMFYSEGSRSVSGLLVLMLVFATISLFCIPITVYVSFRIEPFARRLIGWLLLTGVAFLCIFVSSIVVEEGLGNAVRALPYLCVGVPTGCLTVAVGLTAFRSSGYQLTYFEPLSRRADELSQESVAQSAAVPNERTELVDSWLEDESQPSQRHRFRLDGKWQARLAIGMVVVAAAVGGIVVHLQRQRDIHRFQQFINEDVRSARIETAINALAFSASFEDADLDDYTIHEGNIAALSFAGTKVTDAVFPKLQNFPYVQQLDFSRTSITAAGLLSWKPFAEPQQFNRQIARLSLADTKVDWSKVSGSAGLALIRHWTCRVSASRTITWHSRYR